jgi:hypothetical protein
MMKFCRGEERMLTHKDVADWIAARIKAGPLKGIKPMWEDCMREFGGQISRRRFAELRKTQMGILQIDAPRPGRPPGR